MPAISQAHDERSDISVRGAIGGSVFGLIVVLTLISIFWVRRTRHRRKRYCLLPGSPDLYPVRRTVEAWSAGTTWLPLSSQQQMNYEAEGDVFARTSLWVDDHLTGAENVSASTARYMAQRSPVQQCPVPNFQCSEGRLVLHKGSDFLARAANQSNMGTMEQISARDVTAVTATASSNSLGISEEMTTPLLGMTSTPRDRTIQPHAPTTKQTNGGIRGLLKIFSKK